MFIGQSLVYFFYLYQKKYYLNKIEKKIYDKTFSNYNNFLSKQSIVLILLCSFTELISKIKYYNKNFSLIKIKKKEIYFY